MVKSIEPVGLEHDSSLVTIDAMVKFEFRLGSSMVWVEVHPSSLVTVIVKVPGAMFVKSSVVLPLLHKNVFEEVKPTVRSIDPFG